MLLLCYRYKKPFEERLAADANDEEAKKEIARADNDIKILTKNLKEFQVDDFDAVTAEDTLHCKDDGDYIAKTIHSFATISNVELAIWSNCVISFSPQVCYRWTKILSGC